MREWHRNILSAISIVIIVYGLVGLPVPSDDIDGVILTTIKATVKTENKEILISTKNIGHYPNMSINDTSIVFMDRNGIQRIADRDGPTEYHEFKEIRFVWFGYRVAIDHLVMYPVDSPRFCHTCYGDLGVLYYRKGEWVYNDRGQWVS